MSAAGDRCQCRVRFLISSRSRGHKRASRAAAAINTGRCGQAGQKRLLKRGHLDVKGFPPIKAKIDNSSKANTRTQFQLKIQN